MASAQRVVLDVTLNVSPTLSLSDPEARIELKVGVKIAESTRAGTPVTLLAHNSIFDVDPINPFFDVFARGLFTPLKSVEGPGGRSIWLNPRLRVREGLDTDEPDLRRRGVNFVTIPGDSSQEVVLHHHLSWERLFKHADRGTPGFGGIVQKDQLELGEKFEIRVNGNRPTVVLWWCFGDLETDLKDKRFHSWIMDNYGDGHPPDEDSLREGNWVLGEDPEISNLEIRMVPGGNSIVKIVQ